MTQPVRELGCGIGRAVAALLIVFFHVGYLRSGYLGVDLFFALSGYLITTILLREYREERWSLGRFHLRRLRRLRPALILTLRSGRAWRRACPN